MPSPESKKDLSLTVAFGLKFGVAIGVDTSILGAETFR
jgi:hypothetical protein